MTPRGTAQAWEESTAAESVGVTLDKSLGLLGLYVLNWKRV